MKAIEISSFGSPDVLHLVERTQPQFGPGEVSIRVSASGVNRPDVLQRMGRYPAPEGVSDIPGLEVAGIIAAGDASAMQAAGLKVGDRVCALVAGGGYAQWCVAPVGQCLPIPANLTDVEAASLPETFFTVWSNLFQRAHLQPGQVLLVQGGSSGIGVAAIQLAKALGQVSSTCVTQVIVTAGTQEKCAACLELGADYAINYKTHDFQAEVMRITAGCGVDVVLDMVAGDYVDKEVHCLSEDGSLVIIAVQGGIKSQFDAGLVLRKRLTITGSTLRARSLDFKSKIAQALRAQVWPLLEQGRVKPVVYQTFAAVDAVYPGRSGASQAHALMESNQHIGKIVLTWSEA